MRAAVHDSGPCKVTKAPGYKSDKCNFSVYGVENVPF